WMKYPGTVGKPWPNSEVIVVDDEGNELPPYEAGTIYMRMGANQSEYYKDDDKTKKSRLKDSGVWTVGDAGYFNEDGFPFPIARSNALMCVGGGDSKRAGSEGTLAQPPAVTDAAVCGIPNEDTGEAIKAVIGLREGIEPGDEATKS